MKITQLYIDDFGLSETDRNALLNTGGNLRSLKDDAVVGMFHGVLSPSSAGAAIRNRVYNSLRNPRPDDVSTVLLKNLQGTVVSVKGKATWISSQKLIEAEKELSTNGSIATSAVVGINSSLAPNKTVGQEPIIVTNNVIAPKTTDSYSAYLVKNKRLWVAAIVIDCSGNSCYTIPTPYTGVYYYKSKGGDADGNVGTIKPWSFPNVSDSDGISVTAFAMDLPLAGQVVDSNQIASGAIAANYVIESNVLKTSLNKEDKQQFVIYVPFETLRGADTANQGPIKFIKSGDVYNSISSGASGGGVSLDANNVLITASGDTITSSDTANLNPIPSRGNSSGINNRYEALPNLIEIGVAAAAGIIGAKLLTKDKSEKQKSAAITVEESKDALGVTDTQRFTTLFKNKSYEI